MANEPIVNAPNLYIDNLQVTRTAARTGAVAAGECRDDTNVYDIIVSAPLVLTMSTVGANGLDTGAIAATKLYYIYVIIDIMGFSPPACLASVSATAPVMPKGYGAKRIVGYLMTDGSSNFLLNFQFGTSNNRVYFYDTPRATAVTAGTSATYADVVLTNFVPPVSFMPVLIQYNWTANAAADVLNLQPFGGTGDMVTAIAPVAGATAHTVGVAELPMGLNAGVGQVEYKVSAVGGVALNVVGFRYSL